ncbi:MAG: hypothetical protein AAF235_06610 [Planctomycetota bacterium]
MNRGITANTVARPAVDRSVGRSLGWAVGRAGFTLVEVAVTIGVMAVLTFIVAQVFATVGDTVANGKRTSTLNRRAAQLEQVMRQDFERMARGDGFLVIRNEYAQTQWDDDAPSNPIFEDEPEDKVQLFAGDLTPRRRRIDEIMFFVTAPRGESFTSSREPLATGTAAQSREARIYYGHGQRYPVDVADNRSNRPMLDETNIPAAGFGGRLGEPSSAAFENPNELASDWSLLRHVTLLSQTDDAVVTLPERVMHLRPDTVAAEVFRQRVRDSSRQVALQPAVQSIFRAIAPLQPDLPGELAPWPAGIRPGQDVETRRGGEVLYLATGRAGFFRSNFFEAFAAPLFSSGLVDIATTNLSEIRSTVESPYLRAANPGEPPALVYPDEISGPSNDAASDILINDADIQRNGAAPPQTMSGWQNLWDATGPVAPTRATPSGLVEGPVSASLADQVQQVWMLNALPTEPFRNFGGNPNSRQDRTGHRMRYEDAPRGSYVREMSDADDEEKLLDAIEQADQAMLRSSVFMKNCSEFIVEFSMGIVDDNPESQTFGQLVWHGLRRWVDDDFNGVFDPGERLIAWDDLEVIPVDNTITNEVTPGNLRAPAELLSPSTTTGIGATPLLNSRLNDLSKVFPHATVDEDFGPDSVDATNPDAGYVTGAQPEDMPSQAWVFGYADTPLGVAGGGAAGPSLLGAQAPTTQERPWPWPRLIRVTVRLTDEEDRSVETTYQSVFRVPGLPAN